MRSQGPTAIADDAMTKGSVKASSSVSTWTAVIFMGAPRRGWAGSVYVIAESVRKPRSACSGEREYRITGLPRAGGRVVCGALAQLGERLDRTQEVSGSNPLCSTILLLARIPIAARTRRDTPVPLPPGGSIAA